MKIAFRQTNPEYKHLGEWEAQVENLPQARCYGATAEEAVGKLLLRFGKEQGIQIGKSSEMSNQRRSK